MSKELAKTYDPKGIEERLYKKFNAILTNEVDFVIENAAELCEEIST